MTQPDEKAGTPKVANTVWKHLGMVHSTSARKAVCPRCTTPYEGTAAATITCDNGRACGATVIFGA